ncbi:hypothetical protein F8568_026715 [Actinomadura sp. LD22]|uniref:Uncharacterized protein n=1 Tax=Actinomadura physcomitrii TaxID=2650748 RepID=A0A6I4MDZ0_9ACTN|nr:hypothetical protein [Actinomadura physcomitrii]MWA03912.1 hypothetical protein [Actinomadura physcomitrii]
MTRTDRDGHDTDPMVAVTGCGAAVLVGVFDGLCVVFFVGVGEVVVPLGLGLADVEVVEDACAPEPDDFISAGTAISAPMTRNTAAMMTLGNCIAVLLARGGLSGRRVIRDHS